LAFDIGVLQRGLQPAGELIARCLGVFTGGKRCRTSCHLEVLEAEDFVEGRHVRQGLDPLRRGDGERPQLVRP
jgi:hypothetical protein